MIEISNTIYLDSIKNELGKLFSPSKIVKIKKKLILNLCYEPLLTESLGVQMTSPSWLPGRPTLPNLLF
jgi:hypothetical protein